MISPHPWWSNYVHQLSHKISSKSREIIWNEIPIFLVQYVQSAFSYGFPMVFPWVFPWLGFRARQGASKVADLVLQAAHAAGCENQTPLAAVPWNETGGTGWNWWNSAWFFDIFRLDLMGFVGFFNIGSWFKGDLCVFLMELGLINGIYSFFFFRGIYRIFHGD